MRLYLSGPMTGCPDLNRPAFASAAARWRARGHDVVNPHDLPFEALWASLRPQTPFLGRWRDYMLADLSVLLTCRGIVLLANWHQSPGARLEYQTATALGFLTFEDDFADAND